MTTDKHEASRGISATAELFVLKVSGDFTANVTLVSFVESPREHESCRLFDGGRAATANDGVDGGDEGPGERSFDYV